MPWLVYPDWQIVVFMVAWVTSIAFAAPGVQAPSGRPPWLVHRAGSDGVEFATGDAVVDAVPESQATVRTAKTITHRSVPRHTAANSESPPPWSRRRIDQGL